MTVEVESASKSELRIRVLDFEGECVGDPRATKHLKDIRPGILKLVLSRRVGDLGPSSALDVVDGNEAGWAGMMVMKALGVYEFGFTDFVYPDRPVALKDTWTANFDILQEARFGAEVAADVGKHESKAVFRDGTAKVVFRLESVAKVAGRERARVSYRFDQNATYTYEDLLGQAMREAGVRWTQTGEFVVDLGTGWIDAFTADRSVENTYGSEHQKEHTVTEVRLQ